MILAGCVLALAACSKSFLDTEDLTTASEQNYYKTPKQAETALVGVYDGLQRVWSDGVALPLAAEVMSDNAFGGTGNADGFSYQMMDEFDKLRSPSDQNLFNGNWIAYYKAVYRANMLINKLAETGWQGTEAQKLAYEAEARFIRAYLYFDMTRLWGNVPLLTEPSNDNIPQSSADEVYKVIAEDLKFAKANLSATPYQSMDTTKLGRANKWATEALMGRVFLFYTGYYGKSDLVGVVTKAEALAGLEDVISNSGHALVPEFKNLWPAASPTTYVGENNIETVFAIKYTFTSDYNGNSDGNHWMVMNGIREQTIPPYGLGWGGSTINPKLWNAYVDGDKRKTATIISIAGENLPFEKKTGQREYTGYYGKKYTPMADEDGNSLAVKMGGVNFMIGQFQDYVSIRYADVLLMAAELGSAKAQQYLDDVRKRAFGAGFTSLAPTKDNIMKERRLEFALEGHRYYDLLRQGIAVAASTIAESVTLENGGVATPKSISAGKINETKGLVQIPNTQITLSNNVLVQNAGW